MLESHFPFFSQPLNQSNQTKDTPALVYFDNAATSQKPKVVIDAICHYYQHQCANVHRGGHQLGLAATQAFERARQQVAEFIGSQAHNLIWTRGTTEAINLACYSYLAPKLNAGDEILITAMEHHANLVPWQQLAMRHGAVLKVCPLGANGDLDLDAYASLLNSRTRFVAITHASNVTGAINPVNLLIKQAKAVGAKVLVDGAQAVPHLNVDVEKMGCDFYAFSGHKTFGPDGIGALWASNKVLAQMQPWQFGGEMVASVRYEHTEFQASQLKFEAGTPAVAAAIGLGAACEWLTAQNLNTLHDYEKLLLNYLKEQLATVKGLRFVANPKHQVPLVSFVIDQWHCQDIGSFLDEQGIIVRAGKHCAMPHYEHLNQDGSVRVSLAFYNTPAEIDRLIAALKQMIASDSSTDKQSADANSPTPNSTHWHYVEPYLPKLLAAGPWQAKQRLLIQLAKENSHYPESLRTPEHKVQGCDSDTWVVRYTEDNHQHIRVDSKARIIKGLLVVVAHYMEQKPGCTLSEVEAYLSQLGAQGQLSPSRSNGLRAALDKLCDQR
ncbi:MAG: SufS family cysteine desulfurase [Pontibacterium sp.]